MLAARSGVLGRQGGVLGDPSVCWRIVFDEFGHVVRPPWHLVGDVSTDFGQVLQGMNGLIVVLPILCPALSALRWC